MSLGIQYMYSCECPCISLDLCVQVYLLVKMFAYQHRWVQCRSTVRAFWELPHSGWHCRHAECNPGCTQTALACLYWSHSPHAFQTGARGQSCTGMHWSWGQLGYGEAWQDGCEVTPRTHTQHQSPTHYVTHNASAYRMYFRPDHWSIHDCHQHTILATIRTNNEKYEIIYMSR